MKKKALSSIFFVAVFTMLIMAVFVNNMLILRLTAIIFGLILFSAMSVALINNKTDDEETKDDAIELAKAYLIATAINPEWHIYKAGSDEEDPFPFCCVNLAKSISQKSQTKDEE